MLFIDQLVRFKATCSFNECLELYRPLRTNPRSNADPLRLTFPMTRSKAGDRTFTVTAALVWNELPSYIKSAQSVDVFKKVLKTYLFPN